MDTYKYAIIYKFFVYMASAVPAESLNT
ncbi:hypothetical protein DSUL_20080 [Desulfovibrionales bacterium]